MKKLNIAGIIFYLAGISLFAQSSVDINLKDNYLNLPVSFDGDDEVKLELIIDNEVVRDLLQNK